VVTKQDQEFLADVLARKDRAKDGVKPCEAIDLIQDVNPTLSRNQARRHLTRTLIPLHPGKLKPKPAVAQATTTKHTGITLTQQYRWQKTYDGALNELRTRNTGVCNLTVKTFGELNHHFISGGDETCLQASANGTVHVIGSTGRKKHEKINSDLRVSIKTYRTGSIAGDTGPTIFLMKGDRGKAGWTDKFLIKNGAKEGSTIVMTESTFMTTEAWEKMTPSMCAGLRKINKYVKANPQWYMLEIFDGFGAHLASLPAMEIRLETIF
jgi:hypothetical protein